MSHRKNLQFSRKYESITEFFKQGLLTIKMKLVWLTQINPCFPKAPVFFFFFFFVVVFFVLFCFFCEFCLLFFLHLLSVVSVKYLLTPLPSGFLALIISFSGNDIFPIPIMLSLLNSSFYSIHSRKNFRR